MRKLTFMHKDSGSNTGQCPAIYRTKGGYVLQGKTLDQGETDQLRDLAADESAVFVPANVIDRLRDMP